MRILDKNGRVRIEFREDGIYIDGKLYTRRLK